MAIVYHFWMLNSTFFAKLSTQLIKKQVEILCRLIFHELLLFYKGFARGLCGGQWNIKEESCRIGQNVCVFCNRKRSKKLGKTGVWRQCEGSSFVNRSACIFGRNMQVYEIWTKKKSKCAGENRGFVNRWKLWIMWISRCKTPFSLKKGENGCAKLIHKTGDKMWIMWTTRSRTYILCNLSGLP